jgi:hypothetical protein
MAGNPFTSAQAPNPMQMLAPDIATQQMQVARQQQLADMLRQQALQPDPGTQVINGWAVRKSPLEALGRMATALMATKGQSSIDDKQLALAKAMQGRMSDVFDSMAGASPSGGMPARGGTAASGAQPTSQEPPQPSGATTDAGPAPVPMPALSQIDRIRNQAKAAYLMGNTDLANKLLENVSTLTNEQKNMAAMGQDTLQMGRYATAAARKSGIIELQPGTTALDLSTGQERFQPKVGEGISLNGGVAAPLPGYADANAAIAGASADATARAQAGHKLITVNTASGPVMMTEEQAAQQAGGGQPAPRQPSGPTPTSPTKVDLMHMTPEQKEKFMAAARAQFDMRPGSRPGTSAEAGAPVVAATRVGIPLKTPAQEAQELADVKVRTEPQLAQSTKEATDMADYGKTLNGHLADSQALLQRIAQSREALKKFQAGGGGDTRVQIAQLAQAIPGMPTSVVDKIAGGNLSAAQEFQKYAAQEALGTMQQALASDTGKGSQGNRIAMQLFIKNNPNIDTDPRAIEKIFNFQTQLHNQLKAQSDAYQQFKKAPGNNPADFPNWWASEAIKRGFVKPEIVSGYAKGVPPEVQAVLDKYK